MVYLNQMKFTNYLNKYKYFIIFLVFGLLIFLYPLLKTKFDIVIGGYDNLYFNYVLEHSLLWIKGIHNSFWSAPFNYNSAYSVAQADSLLGLHPIYWSIRLFIKNPMSAFQILFIVLCILNYSTFYILLKMFKLKNLACSIGSFVFAFSTLRFFNLDNISYFSQFLSVISIICILKVNKNNKVIINHIYFLIASIFLILQFYSCFALGYFFIFCLIFALIFSLLPKNSRDIIIPHIRYFYKHILFYLFIVFLSLLPMAFYFSNIEHITPLSKILSNIANYTIWTRSISISDNIIKFRYEYIAQNACLSSMSLGIFTTIFALYGLYKTPKIKGVSLITLLFIVLSCSGYSAIYFWRLFYYFSFGVESLESINAIAFWTLFIIAFGVALLFNRKMNKILFVIAIILISLEQISYSKDPNSYLKNNFISKSDFIFSINQIKSKDNIIKIVPKAIHKENFGKYDIVLKDVTAQKIADLNALWLSLKENKPTINNYPQKRESKKDSNVIGTEILVDYNQI